MAFEGAVTLRVRIEKLDDAGRCRATLRRGWRGWRSASVEFDFPLSTEEIEKWTMRPFSLLAPRRASEGTRNLSEIGDRLFEAIFHDSTLDLYRESHALAERNKAMLRIVLYLTAEEHFPLPWEGLHDPSTSRFLSTELRTVIVRYLPDGEKPPKLRGRDPLRVLAVISAPSDKEKLDTAEERRRLEKAMSELVTKGRVTLEWFVRPPERNMHTALLDQLNAAAKGGTPYDVFHFIGHAEYNIEKEEGEIIFEGKDGTGHTLSGIELGEGLVESGLSLVLLNACESASAGRLPYRSVAAELVRRANIPLAVANQMQVRDRTAIAFADAFYGAIAEHATVEEAMLEARRAVSRKSVDLPDWVTSVFFTRYMDKAARLLPNHFDALRPWVLGGGLYLLMLAVGISTISLFRHFGLTAGVTLQLGFLALVGALAFLLLDEVLRRRKLIAAIWAAASLSVALFFLWNPTLPAVEPPPGFALTIEEPPLATTESDLVVTPLTVRVEGTVANMPPDHHLWILVRVYDKGTFAVGGEATVSGDRFVAPSVIVGPISTLKLDRRPYVLQPVLVDAEGHEAMIEHGLQRWRIFHPDFHLEPAPTLPSVLVLRE